MNITNRRLTLTQDTTAGGNVTCVAGCHVDLNPGDLALLTTGTRFRLTCVIMGVDPRSETPLFTFTSREYTNIGHALSPDQVFEKTLPRTQLDEDKRGDNVDEIRASFTLTNLRTAETVIKNSNKVKRAL